MAKSIDNEIILAESLILKKGVSKRHGNVLMVVSDETDPKAQRNETYRNKGELFKGNFKWDPDPEINSWVIPQEYLAPAQRTLEKINKKPFEKFIDKIIDPGFCVTVINQMARNETINVRMYGLNITVYRSFDIPKKEIILHESTL